MVYNQIDYKYLSKQQRLEGYMQNSNLLENLSKVFEQSTFVQSQELFKKIVDMAAQKLLTKQANHKQLTKKIISDRINSRYTTIRKFKRINKRVISKKKLRENVIKKISISNKQIHERYQEFRFKKCSKSTYQECIHHLFGVPFYSDQQEEKQQSPSLERQCQQINQMAKTKRVPHQTQKNKTYKKPSSIYKDQVQKKFKKIHTNFQNYVTSKQKESKTDELICPICIEILIEPVSTVCGHTFCYSCLDESLLFTHTCPVCRFHIKGMELVPCNHLSELIRIKCEGKSMTSEQIETYHHRKKQNDKWREKRFIKVENFNFVSDIPIDVRDTQNIWCPAIILNIFYVDERISSVLVHYLQWADLYNEVIEIKSNRLAPWGCFTKRTDIPRYNLHQENENLRGTVVNGIQNYQHEVIRPEQNLSLLGHLRNLQNTVNTFRNMAWREQPEELISQNSPRIFIMQNPFESFNFSDQQSSQNDPNNSRQDEEINEDEMAQEQQVQGDSLSEESVQEEVPYGLLNSDEVSPEIPVVDWAIRNPYNNDRNYHQESSLENDDEEEQENARRREQSQQKSPSENDSGMIVVRRPANRNNYYDDEESSQSHGPQNQQIRGRMVFRNGVHYLI